MPAPMRAMADPGPDAGSESEGPGLLGCLLVVLYLAAMLGYLAVIGFTVWQLATDPGPDTLLAMIAAFAAPAVLAGIVGLFAGEPGPALAILGVLVLLGLGGVAVYYAHVLLGLIFTNGVSKALGYVVQAALIALTAALAGLFIAWARDR